MNPKFIRALCIRSINSSDVESWIMDIDTRLFESMTYLEHNGDFYIIHNVIVTDNEFVRNDQKCDCIIMCSKSDGYKKFDPKQLEIENKTMPICHGPINL